MVKKIFSILTTVLLVLSFGNLLFSQKGEDFVYDSKGRRDPFIPLIAQRAELATGLGDIRSIDDVILEGILWDPEGDSVAILNGMIIKEGQVIGNIKIERIGKKEVVLFINEEEHKIELIKEGDEHGEE